jgi:GNAT superfamily N-acetyltransferase
MREYRPGDEVRIVRYQNLEMGPERRKTVGLWKWTYSENPSGIMTIWIAEDGEAIAGHYALMPLQMKVGKETLSGAQSVDTYTNQEYRRQGIFAKLATEVYALAADKGISVFYGFPSIASYHGFVKRLDWIRVTSLDKMHRPLNLTSLLVSSLNSIVNRRPMPLLRLLWRMIVRFSDTWRVAARASEVRIKRIERFDRSADLLWEKIAAGDEIRVVKDARYLNWRYCEKPQSSYAIYQVELNGKAEGFVVIDQAAIRSRFQRTHIVTDVITETKADSIRVMLFIASRIVKKLGGDSMTVWVPGGSHVHGILASEGYFQSGELILIARQNRNVFDPRILRDTRRWFIMAGDTDVA